MSNIITTGYGTEGTTDKRFLLPIIKRTFDEIAYNCQSDIEVYDPINLLPENKLGFVNDSIDLAKQAYSTGLNVLCIHSDSDDVDDNLTRQNKINPAFGAIQDSNLDLCKNLVSIVPVRMSEAWMLADRDLLRQEMCTSLSNNALFLPGNPEAIADPKSCIINALRIAQSGISKRRDKIEISELYQPIGQKISLDKLKTLESYRKFRSSVEDAFRQLNYLY